MADEVRGLANRTQASTGEINEMIGHLTDQVGAAAEATRAAGQKADFSEQRVESAAEALAEIAGKVHALNDLNTQIASAPEEQTAVAEEISRNVANIRDSVQETASGTQQSTRASGGRARLATELQGRVRRFNV